MRISKLIIVLATVLPLVSCSQADYQKIGKEINKTLSGGTTLSNAEIISGLKQALEIGSQNAGKSTSKVDGFFRNPLIKIPFPPEAIEMEKKLRAIGMGKQVDEFVMTINRAAEEASKQASPVFVDAIKGMSITDGLSILRGADTAATGYLRQRTASNLRVKFKPVIHSATQKVNVTKYWSPLINTYNAIPLVKKMNPDLDAYITDRALHGLFKVVSQEEIKIRRDPAARVTELLKKVFGS
ncbi:MAG TPA: DUF4197 domain-containing protein [Bacteroidia bacterium]|nr:DUF4197 domain-containing protein [Bacteroidia bacterium]